MSRLTDVHTKWQRLATKKLGSWAMQQFLQWCQPTVDDTHGTEEYNCDAYELVYRYANVYTFLQLTSKKTPEAKVRARLVRAAIAWQIVSIIGINGSEPDYETVIKRAFDNKIEFPKKTTDLVSQLLKAYHEAMAWYPYKFQSRTDIKSHGRKRSKRKKRDGLGRKNHAKQDPEDPTVVMETVTTEPWPVILGYGKDSTLDQVDVKAPMRVFTTEEEEATYKRKNDADGKENPYNKIPMRVLPKGPVETD